MEWYEKIFDAVFSPNPAWRQKIFGGGSTSPSINESIKAKMCNNLSDYSISGDCVFDEVIKIIDGPQDIDDRLRNHINT